MTCKGTMKILNYDAQGKVDGGFICPGCVDCDGISLCRDGCFSMTKTIEGFCGKCKSLKSKEPKKNWENNPAWDEASFIYHTAKHKHSSDAIEFIMECLIKVRQERRDQKHV